MPQPGARTTSRIEPAPAWSVMTDAPLKGLTLAREAGSVVAWDEADQLYRISPRGEFQSVARAPGRILALAGSDDGSLVAILGEGSRLWLLDGDFELLHERATIPDPVAIAVDPHGRYVALSSKLNIVQFYTKYARLAGKFETRQPLSSMQFVPDRPFLVGTGSFGSVSGFALDPRGRGSAIDGTLVWDEALMSSVGRMATTGDGSMVLVACFTHGVQRYDLDGRGEGAYHLGGSAGHAVPDFAGRSIAVATLEGELALLNAAGNVKWRSPLNRPAIALEIDPLGRHVIYGQATGEVVRLDLQPTGRSSSSTPAPAPTRALGSRSRIGSASVRVPEWVVEVVPTEDHAEYAVVAIVDDPPRIGVISQSNRLELYSDQGKRVGQAPEIDGVGRILRTAPGWMAAATDRRIMLCDLRRNTAQRLDMSLVELTHLAILPDTHGLALVQERDRIGRASASGRWIWKTELDSPVEDLAIDSEGYTAITTEDGRLRVFDPSGSAAGSSTGAASDPSLLIAAPAASPIRWLTLTRRAQVLRGHGQTGRVAWEVPIPWEAWQLHGVGERAVVVAPDGRALAFDASGRLLVQGRADAVPDAFAPGPDGQALRIARQGVHLICTELGGQVAWRCVAEGPVGPLAASQSGVAALIGKSLAWFPTRPTS